MGLISYSKEKFRCIKVPFDSFCYAKIGEEWTENGVMSQAKARTLFGAGGGLLWLAFRTCSYFTNSCYAQTQILGPPIDSSFCPSVILLTKSYKSNNEIVGSCKKKKKKKLELFNIDSQMLREYSPKKACNVYMCPFIVLTEFFKPKLVKQAIVEGQAHNLPPYSFHFPSYPFLYPHFCFHV